MRIRVVFVCSLVLLTTQLLVHGQSKFDIPKKALHAELAFAAPVLSVNYEGFLVGVKNNALYGKVGLGVFPEYYKFSMPHGVIYLMHVYDPLFVELRAGALFSIYEHEEIL